MSTESYTNPGLNKSPFQFLVLKPDNLILRCLYPVSISYMVSLNNVVLLKTIPCSFCTEFRVAKNKPSSVLSVLIRQTPSSLDRVKFSIGNVVPSALSKL